MSITTVHENPTAHALVKLLDEAYGERDDARDDALTLKAERDSAATQLEYLRNDYAESRRELERLSDEVFSLQASKHFYEGVTDTLITAALCDRASFESPITGDNKIPIIKDVRHKWSIGLKEAKDIVDKWQADEARLGDAETHG